MADKIFKDLIVEGLSRLPSQFINSPIIRGLVEAILTNLQPLEDVLTQLDNERDLDTAVGVQLDVLGLLIGLLRGSLTDDQYRKALRVKVSQNASRGTTEDATDTLRKATEDSTSTIYDSSVGCVMGITGGSTLGAMAATDKSLPVGVCIDTLLVDNLGNSFIPSYAIASAEQLETEGEPFEVESPGDEPFFVVQEENISVVPGNRSYLPHSLEPVPPLLINPLCYAMS